MESAFACLKMKTNSKKVVMHTNRQTEVSVYRTARVIMHHLKGEIIIIYFFK